MTIKVFKKDLKDDELEILMKEDIQKMMEQVVPRKKPEESSKENIKESEQDSKEQKLTHEEIEYLESILKELNLSITSRAEFLGLSSYINDKRKTQLLEKGLIEEFTINLGFETRGVVKFLLLTKNGFEALGKKTEKERPKNCSLEHWWWQNSIYKFYINKGYKGQIEMALGDKHADVGLVKGKVKMAIEVELTPKNSVINVKKDLEVGFDKVLVACKNSKVKKSIEERLQPILSEEDWSKVKIILLSEFSFVKDIISKTKK